MGNSGLVASRVTTTTATTMSFILYRQGGSSNFANNIRATSHT